VPGFGRRGAYTFGCETLYSILVSSLHFHDSMLGISGSRFIDVLFISMYFSQFKHCELGACAESRGSSGDDDHRPCLGTPLAARKLVIWKADWNVH
jgi:hypothetical protein